MTLKYKKIDLINYFFNIKYYNEISIRWKYWLW